MCTRTSALHAPTLHISQSIGSFQYLFLPTQTSYVYHHGSIASSTQARADEPVRRHTPFFIFRHQYNWVIRYHTTHSCENETLSIINTARLVINSQHVATQPLALRRDLQKRLRATSTRRPTDHAQTCLITRTTISAKIIATRSEIHLPIRPLF